MKNCQSVKKSWNIVNSLIENGIFQRKFLKIPIEKKKNRPRHVYLLYPMYNIYLKYYCAFSRYVYFIEISYGFFFNPGIVIEFHFRKRVYTL